LSKSRKAAENSWVIDQARKANSDQDRIVLEDPRVRSMFDRRLRKEYWPYIESCLEQTGYVYSPLKPEIESEGGFILERSLSYMLFDIDMVFYRGTLKASAQGWMLENDFFLSLPLGTDLAILFQILENSRFSGYPPTLSISRHSPEYYYQIELHSGYGASWGMFDDKAVADRICEAINVNCKMYELTIHGLARENVAEFLSLAYRVYEAF